MMFFRIYRLKNTSISRLYGTLIASLGFLLSFASLASDWESVGLLDLGVVALPPREDG